MRCPACGHSDSKVLDSRPTENGSIKRRRECEKCKHRFTTYEIIDSYPAIVIKKNGTKEIFDKNKIITGLVKACYKRPVTDAQINQIANEIENEIKNAPSSMLTSVQIGTLVMDRLREVDEVAYVRFASVYREFKDVDTFMKELSNLMDKNSKK